MNAFCCEFISARGLARIMKPQHYFAPHFLRRKKTEPFFGTYLLFTISSPQYHRRLRPAPLRRAIENNKIIQYNICNENVFPTSRRTNTHRKYT